MPRPPRSSMAATAQLEGWRRPVVTALQPMLVVDAEVRLWAASAAAHRLLLLPEVGSPLAAAVGLQDLATAWDDSPFARAVRDGQAQRTRLELPAVQTSLDVVVSPLFGTEGVIGALAFLSSV